MEGFRFLGIWYSPSTGLISGRTRNGSELEFKADHRRVFDLLRVLVKDYEASDMDVLSRTSLWGLMLSRIYSGS